MKKERKEEAYKIGMLAGFTISEELDETAQQVFWNDIKSNLYEDDPQAGCQSIALMMAVLGYTVSAGLIQRDYCSNSVLSSELLRGFLSSGRNQDEPNTNPRPDYSKKVSHIF